MTEFYFVFVCMYHPEFLQGAFYTFMVRRKVKNVNNYNMLFTYFCPVSRSW